MSESAINPAIRFESEAYDMTGPRLMGRQAAGYGFLRAAVAAAGDQPLVGYGPNPGTARDFAGLVARLDPAARTEWVLSDQLDLLSRARVCFRPDPVLAPEARLRLRVGAARHSLCGLTHTISTGRMMDAIADLLAAPLMPWDAVVCTSSAAVGVLEAILGEQAQYLAWRFGVAAPAAPYLPVIPLGVHSADYVATDDDRSRARSALGIGEADCAALYAGRLSFADKAHPFAMMVALQAAAERTGTPVVLILAGKFLNPPGEAAYRLGLQQYCPDVRCVIVDGGDFDAYRRAWSAADLFVSAADSTQETFGLTPVEAMASGLPCVVSDWNGYRDTIRPGVDGFRVATWAPAPGLGEPLARALEAEVDSDGTSGWRQAAATLVDLQALADSLARLIENPDLRRTMGAAGRARARQDFEWASVYAQYQALWAELDARRLAAGDDPDQLARLAAAPRAAAQRLDPFKAFSHYPSRHIGADTPVSLDPSVSLDRYRQVTTSSLFTGALATPDMALPLLRAIEQGAGRVGEVAVRAGRPLPETALTLATLAKMGLVRFGVT